MLPQVTLQSTAKPSVAPKYSHMDYQTFRPMTKPPQKPRIFTRRNFAEHNFNFVNRSQTSKPPRTNQHNRSFSQRQTSNFGNFNDNLRIPTNPSENYPFFQQNKNSTKQYQFKQKTPYYTPNYHSSGDDEFHDQNHQQNFQNQRLQSYHVNQPDIFEPYTREQHMRQPRSNTDTKSNKY